MTIVLASSFESFMQLLGVLLIFVFVLVLTYITTRWIASYQKSHNFNRNLEIIETLNVAANKYVQIVRAGDEYLVIAVGKEEIQLLTKLTEEQVIKLSAESPLGDKSLESFKTVFEKIKDNLPKR